MNLNLSTPFCLCPLNFVQFLDQNGVPLSGGLLWVYLAGTNNKHGTFADSDGNVKNTNPLVLDSRGSLGSQLVWLKSGDLYKFVLETAPNGSNHGQMLNTWDGVPGMNDVPIVLNFSKAGQVS
jgi:hypothetical protein